MKANGPNLFDLPLLWVRDAGKALALQRVILYFRGTDEGEVSGSVRIPHRSLLVGLPYKIPSSIWVEIFPSLLIHILRHTKNEASSLAVLLSVLGHQMW